MDLSFRVGGGENREGPGGAKSDGKRFKFRRWGRPLPSAPRMRSRNTPGKRFDSSSGGNQGPRRVRILAHSARGSSKVIQKIRINEEREQSLRAWGLGLSWL